MTGFDPDIGQATVERVRRETAEAVIERAHALWLRNSSWIDVLTRLRDEFGVDS